jgi:hypothetical protein
MFHDCIKLLVTVNFKSLCSLYSYLNELVVLSYTIQSIFVLMTFYFRTIKRYFDKYMLVKWYIPIKHLYLRYLLQPNLNV